jgi:hypothetical protein
MFKGGHTSVESMEIFSTVNVKQTKNEALLRHGKEYDMIMLIATKKVTKKKQKKKQTIIFMVFLSPFTQMLGWLGLKQATTVSTYFSVHHSQHSYHSKLQNLCNCKHLHS